MMTSDIQISQLSRVCECIYTTNIAMWRIGYIQHTRARTHAHTYARTTPNHNHNTLLYTIRLRDVRI